MAKAQSRSPTVGIPTQKWLHCPRSLAGLGALQVLTWKPPSIFRFWGGGGGPERKAAMRD